jgi:rhamnogalacturonan endolyase
VKTQTADLVDVGMKRLFTDQPHAVDLLERIYVDDARNWEMPIGISDWRTDWNYAHSGYPTDWSPWPWRINFSLDSVPTSGNAILTLAFASANSARVDIYVNDETTPLTRLYPPVSGGNALIREGIHAKYGVSYVPVPVALLQPGANTMTLVQGRSTGASEHVMYDYINLELPAPATTSPTRVR